MSGQETMASSNNHQEWLQYYYQQMTDKHDDHHQAHAGDSSTPSKPIRRRSRASKKTPTTLLNANVKNFRALVQKFTGCPNNSNISLANQKGPVNLNFGLTNATSTVEPSRNHCGYRRESSQPELEVPPQNHQRQQQQQQSNFQENNNSHNMGQDCTYSYLKSTMTSDAFSNPITSMNASSVTEMYSDGFVMDKDLSVNEFLQSGFIFD